METTIISLEIKYQSDKFPIEVNLNSTVEVVKKSLEQKLNIPVSEQKLLCKGK